MIIRVQFKSKEKPEIYDGFPYPYFCDLDANIGDIVKVPTGNRVSVARVSAVNVNPREVEPEWLPKLKNVIGWADYESTLIGENTEAPDDPALPALPDLGIPEDVIIIKQLPVIEEQLHGIRLQEEKKVEEALSLACTPETVTAVTQVRSEIRKRFDFFESKRKQVKEAVNGPYKRFEAKYNEEIADMYKEADKKLKEKIDAVNDGIRDQKREALRSYFEEYRRSVYLAGEEMADFDAWCQKVNKSASDKSLRDAAKAFLDGLRSDLDTIATMDNSEEIRLEYKARRSLSEAISAVYERNRKKEEERRRLADEAAERAAREAREREIREKVQAAVAAERPEPLEPPVVTDRAEPAPTAKDPNQVFPKAAFTLFNVKRYQLQFIKNYLLQEGIEYK